MWRVLVCCLSDETAQTRIWRYVRDVARLFFGQFSEIIREQLCIRHRDFWHLVERFRSIMLSSSTRWNKQKPNRDVSRVVSKAFREDTSSTASARNIPNNHFGSSKARIDDDVKTTCHEPIPFRQRGSADVRVFKWCTDPRTICWIKVEQQVETKCAWRSSHWTLLRGEFHARFFSHLENWYHT